jgi:DNA-binding NtrC family response regulator
MKKAPEESLRGKRVLVVEDEYMTADDLEPVLERQDCIVLGPVASVRNALAILEVEARIDAAVLDIHPDEETSFAVAGALMARGVRRLFATALATGTFQSGMLRSKAHRA